MRSRELDESEEQEMIAGKMAKVERGRSEEGGKKLGKPRSRSMSQKSRRRIYENFDHPMMEHMEASVTLSKVMAVSLALQMGLFDFLDRAGEISIETTEVKENEKERVNTDTTLESKDQPFVEISEIKEKLGLKIHLRQFSSILDKLMHHGFLEREGKLEEASYRNTEYASRFFTLDSPESFVYICKGFDRHMRKFLTTYQNMKSGKLVNIIDDVYADKEDTKSLLTTFAHVNQNNYDFLLKTFDFKHFKTVIDSNGKNAELAIKLKSAYPDMNIVSFDHPAVEPFALENLKKNKMEDQIQLEYGDVREATLPPCDAVVAAHLLQYFFEDKKKSILQKLYEGLNPNGALLIIENLIYEPKRDIEPNFNKLEFLFTLQSFEGVNQTPEELETMLKEVGFNEVKIHHKEGLSHLVIARKKFQ